MNARKNVFGYCPAHSSEFIAIAGGVLNNESTWIGFIKKSESSA